MKKIACVSVDLDEIPCYEQIHGIPHHTESAHKIYDKALPRFKNFFSELNIPATFFVIGKDLTRPQNRQSIASLHAQGHEIANHTMNHPYAFSRLDARRTLNEINLANEAIENVIHETPLGFRAPGYAINNRIFKELSQLNMLYDSSVFPCPAYYAAKATVLATMSLRGKKSKSILDHPRVLTANTQPYRVGTPYTRRGSGLLEIPIGTTPWSSGRFPYIGTSLALAGVKRACFLTRRMLNKPFINLEMHGIDLTGCEEDNLAHLRHSQPDLRIALESKRQTFHAVLKLLSQHGYQFMTLASYAKQHRAMY